MGTTSDSQSPELAELANPERLASYIASRLGTPVYPLELEGQAKSGSSNITLFVRWHDERWVLRRPPSGPLLPTSHDMLREFKFLKALEGTNVRVPVPILACDDASIIGTPFYLMKRVDGVLLQDGQPPELQTPAARAAVCESAIDALAAIHAVDWSSRGLTDRGEPYIQRQIRRWSRQLELTATRGRVAGLEKVAGWLAERMPPPASPTIVHGDFGLHNMILSASPPPRVLAVLDWEMATIGDPIADVIWFLRGWGVWPSRNPANELPSLPGALSEDEMVARYEAVTGRQVEDRLFYEVFSSWKGAVILEGLYASYLEGNAANESVARFEYEVPEAVANLLELVSLN